MIRDVAEAELDVVVARWRADGFALLPAAAGPEELDALRARADALVREGPPELFFQPDAATGRYDDVTFGQGWEGPDTPYRKVEKLERDPVFRAWLGNPLFERLVGKLIPGPVVLYRSTMFSKAPRLGSDTPWHQDGGPFWGVDPQPEVQLWTALDDAPPEAGCLEFVPGSHLGGLATPLGGVVQRAAADAGHAEERAVAVPARAGDVILLHNLVWHRSGPNTTDAPRRGFTTCYMSAATRCLRKKHRPRVFPAVWG